MVMMLVGFESGMVRCFDKAGGLMGTQHLHMGRVEAVQQRMVIGKEKGLNGRENVWENCVAFVYLDCVVCVEVNEIFESITSSRSNRFWKFQKYRLAGAFESKSQIVLLNRFLDPLENCWNDSLAFVAVGSNPFFSYYPVFSDTNSFSTIQLATKIATKLSNAVFSFATRFTPWSISSKTETPERIAQNTQPNAVSSSFNISDPNRLIISVSLAPTHDFLVTTDSLGRVILFDMISNAAIKWWKGYREAQLGWIYNQSSTHPLFLVIYLPRKEALEIWRVPLGLRIAMIRNLPNCLLTCAIDFDSNNYTSNCFVINENGDISQVLISNEILQLEKGDLFFQKVAAQPSLGETMLCKCFEEIERLNANHICINCLPTHTSELFQVDSCISSKGLEDLFFEFACVSLNDPFSIDFILIQFFPSLRSSDLFAKRIEKKEFRWVSYCPGYVSDTLFLLIRTIGDVVKKNLLNEKLLENQLVRLDLCVKRISIFALLSKLWLCFLQNKEYYDASIEALPTNEFSLKQSRLSVNRSRIFSNADNKNLIDAFDLDNFDCSSFDKSKQDGVKNIQLFSATYRSSFVLSPSFVAYVSSLYFDSTNIFFTFDLYASVKIKQQIASVIFAPLLSIKLEELTDQMTEIYWNIFYNSYGDLSLKKIPSEIEQFFSRLFPFQITDLLQLFIPWFASLRENALLQPSSTLQVCLFFLLRHFFKIHLHHESFVDELFTICKLASGMKIIHVSLLCNVLVQVFRGIELEYRWIELQTKLQIVKFVYNSFNGSAVQNLLSVSSLDNNLSLPTLVSIFLIELALPLTALIRIILNCFPNSSSQSTFNCPTFESLLRDIPEAQIQAFENKVTLATSTLKLLKDRFLNQLHSEYQIIVALVLTLIHRWLEQKRALCFVPLTFASTYSVSNFLTIFLPNSPPMIISECVSASRSAGSKNADAEKLSDSFLEQAVSIVEILPVSIVSIMLSAYIWQSTLAPVVFAFSNWSQRSFHSFLGSIRVSTNRAALLLRLSQRLLLFLISSLNQFSNTSVQTGKLFCCDPKALIERPELEMFVSVRSIEWPSSFDLNFYSLFDFQSLVCQSDFIKQLEVHLCISQTFALLTEFNIESDLGLDIFIQKLFPVYSATLATTERWKNVKSNLPAAVLTSYFVVESQIDPAPFRLSFLLSILKYCVERNHRINSIPSLLTLSHSLLGHQGPDIIKAEYARAFFQLSKDNIGEEYLLQISNKSMSANVLLDIAEQRLAMCIQFLYRLHAESLTSVHSRPLFPNILAGVASDVVNLLLRFEVAPLIKKSYVIKELSLIPSLIKGNQNTFSRVTNLLSRDNVERKKAQSLLDACKQLLHILATDGLK